MTRNEMIAEVESKLPQYAAAGLIDRISLSQYIHKAVKKFGNNVMVKGEKTIEIKNGRGVIPEDFWSLLFAVKVQPVGVKLLDGTEEELLQSHFYRERTEREPAWNNLVQDFTPSVTKTVTEKFVFKKSKAEFEFGGAVLLKPVRAFKRDRCSSKSPNLNRQYTVDSPYEFNIYNRHIQTNFNTGYVYMQYNALPTDDEGDIIIPETQHEELIDYVFYYAQRRVLEDIYMANDDPNVVNKIKLAKGNEKDAERKAFTETKFEGLRNWKEDYIRRKRIETLKYESMLPNK